MPNSIEQYLENLVQEISDFRIALTSESDRGCALFAASYLEKALSDLLYVSFIEDEKIEQDLFDGTAPLSTFSSRIKLAYYTGQISSSVRRDLDKIREIRNHFAHHPEIASFDDQSLSDKSKSLYFSYHKGDHRARGHFTAAVLGILAKLHAATLQAVTPDEVRDDQPTEEKKKATREKVEAIAIQLKKILDLKDQNDA